MAAGTNYWKIGLFVIFGAAALVVLLLVVGARRWNNDTVEYATYFDESVQGLELGAPVKFRGVTVGAVAAVKVAPDRKLVDVRMELDAATVGRLLQTPVSKASALRTQLAQAGLAGQRFVLIDLFDAVKYPEIPLPFAPPERYLSSVPSTLSMIEEAVVETSDQIPAIAERVAKTLERIDATIASIDEAQVPGKVVEGIDEVEKTMQQVTAQLVAADIPATTRDLRTALNAMSNTLGGIDATLKRVNAKDGALSSIEGSMVSVRQVALGAQTLAPQMDTTLKEVQAAARSFRRLADALERDPDMLIKGRASSHP